MKINTMMTSTIRNDANGARTKKIREYVNKENHVDYRIRTNKIRKS